MTIGTSIKFTVTKMPLTFMASFATTIFFYGISLRELIVIFVCLNLLIFGLHYLVKGRKT